MADKPLYSTAKSSELATSGKGKKTSLPAKGPCHVRMERKGRGGKTVTLIDNIPMSEAGAKEFMRSLQQRFACGASLKDGVIILAGDFQKEVKEILKETASSSK